VLVWGFHLGIAGIALGTAFGAWLNVAQLIWIGRRRALLSISDGFRRALLPILLAAAGTGVGAYAGARLAGHLQIAGLWHDLITLAAAGALGTLIYGVVVLAFRHTLPLGRLALKKA
jgi:putative peptidoglycan lipid II flippase